MCMLPIFVSFVHTQLKTKLTHRGQCVGKVWGCNPGILIGCVIFLSKFNFFIRIIKAETLELRRYRKFSIVLRI